MKINDVLHGFLVERVRELPELDGRLWELEHCKTGARLCWLDRPDENKTFSIAFKTIPTDSTGVFHILEHSVLCGSDKYPVKEPFVELLKSSVQTFLNAMTYQDKTVYPVSTRNDQDLLNLMDVYLDAVFHPAIYHRPEIFRQEGWRLEGEGRDLRLQGVVYNEMKGAFAEADTILEDEMNRLLFPDNCYSHVSGGDPDAIPDLTYEAFLANHRKYYHPSNARISLVGDVKLDPVLEKLDGVLSAYERQTCDFPIPMQAPVAPVRREVPYEIAAGEDPKGRAIIAAGTLLGSFRDELRCAGVSILSDYLTGDDDAPLKRAILDRGLAQDFSIVLHDGIQQPWVSWEAWNTDPDKAPALEAALGEVLAREADRGLEEERLAACYSRYAFQLRDRDSSGAPRSLAEALDMLDTWLYDGDPAQGLLVDDMLETLRAQLRTGFLENLIRELFLDNAHTVTLTLRPSADLGAEKAARERDRAAAMTAAWTQADWEAREEEARALARWQQTPDAPEALASIPMLRLSDLAEAPEPLTCAETALEGVPLLRHRLPGELVFLRAHFLASDLTPEELPALSLLCRLLGAMGTARYSRSRLPLVSKQTTGRMSFWANVQEGSAPDRLALRLSAALVCLPEQAEAAGDLLGEILTATDWRDLGLVREVLQQMNMSTQMDLPAQGHRYAITRLSAGTTAHGLARDCLGGVAFAQWLKTMSGAEDEALAGLLETMAALARRLVTRSRLTLSCSETAPAAALERLLAVIPQGDPAPASEAVFPLTGPRQEGLPIPSSVGYAAAGTSLGRHGLAYDGAMAALANVLNYTYLWSEIRVRGGAYGCGFGARSSGDVYFYTYRDPQPARSLEIIAKAPDFLRQFCAQDPDLTGSILSAVSGLDPLRATENRLTAGENRWFRGLEEADVRRWYTQLLETTPARLLELIPVLEAVNADNAVCVSASQPLLEACGPRLKEILTI